MRGDHGRGQTRKCTESRGMMSFIIDNEDVRFCQRDIEVDSW